MTDHTCDKCGKPLNPVNWETVRVGDRFEGRTYKLCSECAELVDSTLRKVMGCDGHVKKQQIRGL